MDGPRLRFPRLQRIGTSGEFSTVFDARQRQTRGVLILHARPNSQGYNRLGISIGRRHGNAVRRNQIKRRLREAFRLHQRDWPQGYDLVLTLKVHAPLRVNEYVEALTALVQSADERWRARGTS